MFCIIKKFCIIFCINSYIFIIINLFNLCLNRLYLLFLKSETERKSNKMQFVQSKYRDNQLMGERRRQVLQRDHRRLRESIYY